MVIDTQTVLWLADEPERISQVASEAILSAREARRLAIASHTLWELAMIIFRRRVAVSTSPTAFLRHVERTFLVLPMTAAIAERAVLFTAPFPKDPSDRIIAATALVHGMPLVTADRLIRRSGQVECIW